MMTQDGTQPPIDEEVGATDNRFEWDPTDENFAETKGWKDGETYRRVTMDVVQVSPGQGRVLRVLDGGTPEGEAEQERNPAQPDSLEQPAETAPGGSMNPAVARMMAAEKY